MSVNGNDDLSALALSAAADELGAGRRLWQGARGWARLRDGGDHVVLTLGGGGLPTHAYDIAVTAAEFDAL